MSEDVLSSCVMELTRVIRKLAEEVHALSETLGGEPSPDASPSSEISSE